MSYRTESPPDPKRTLTERELVSEDLPDWRILIDRLHASFDTGDFVSAVKLVDAVTLAAEGMNHHPDLDLACGRLDVRSAGTSTCASRPRWSRTASPPRSGPAASWSTTPRRRPSGCSPPTGQPRVPDQLAGPRVARDVSHAS